MTWRWLGNKPLSEAMLTRFTDIYASQGGDELRNRNLYLHFLSFLHIETANVVKILPCDNQDVPGVM